MKIDRLVRLAFSINCDLRSQHHVCSQCLCGDFYLFAAEVGAAAELVPLEGEAVQAELVSMDSSGDVSIRESTPR